jgi:acetate kinase
VSDRNFLLVFNTGSSSLKFEVFDYSARLTSVLRGAVSGIGRERSTVQTTGAAPESVAGIAGAGDAAALALERLCSDAGGLRLSANDVVATGHRVVHGGERFSSPVRVTVSVFDALKSLVHLAPLHNPQSLAVMEAVGERFPDVPIVAAFDTAFFHDLPQSARDYAIPAEWSERYSIRRFGFHGIAHQYLSEQMARAPRDGPAPSRVLSLHLGQGCSITALRDGRPVETSMGFTPLEGLVMGTRAGDVDAGVLLHLARQGHDFKELDDALNRRSGLLGLSGVSDDVRRLLELEAGHTGARRALAAFHHRLHKYLGAYAAVLGGVDAVVFGGGIGENSPVVRARICAGLSWLGLELDPEANASCVGSAACISTRDSLIEARVFEVDEEPLIAAAVLSVLGAGARSAGVTA